MIYRIISVVVFYKTDGTILIQDRTNMNKGADWGLFGGGKEGDEDEYQTAIREMQEELNITIRTTDLTRIGYTVVESMDISRYDVTVFVSPWRDEYDTTLILGEGAGMLWIHPSDMKKLNNLYPVDYSHIDIIQKYLSRNNISIIHA